MTSIDQSEASITCGLDGVVGLPRDPHHHEPLGERWEVDKVHGVRAQPILDGQLLAELLDQFALQGSDLLQGQLVPRVGEGGPESLQVLGGDVYHVLDVLALLQRLAHSIAFTTLHLHAGVNPSTVGKHFL